MKKNIRFMNIFLLILCLSGCSACQRKNEPAIELNDDGLIVVNPTAAAESEFFAQTQAAQVEATRQFLMDQVLATAEDIIPTVDPSVQQTPDPADYYTPAPSGATTLQLSNPTNCRSGPGTNYGVMDVIPAGLSVEVLGMDQRGAYYVVRSPSNQVCWLWSHYAEVSGGTNTITIMTPPAPPTDVYTGDWVDPADVQVSDGFSWAGHWVPGWVDGRSYKDGYNAQALNEFDFLYEYYEVDIFQTGNILNIELTDLINMWDGSSAMSVTHAIAMISEDNSMAVGKYYLYEITNSAGNNSVTAVDMPLIWYQNGNPDQFIGGNYFQYILCAARNDASIPVPCSWP